MTQGWEQGAGLSSSMGPCTHVAKKESEPTALPPQEAREEVGFGGCLKDVPTSRQHFSARYHLQDFSQWSYGILTTNTRSGTCCPAQKTTVEAHVVFQCCVSQPHTPGLLASISLCCLFAMSTGHLLNTLCSWWALPVFPQCYLRGADSFDSFAHCYPLSTP